MFHYKVFALRAFLVCCAIALGFALWEPSGDHHDTGEAE
jgi:hypothetical protein